MSSFLIVLEGLDGVGKSSQAKFLQQCFEQAEISCQFLHFPRIEHPPFGPLIQKYLNGEYGNLQTTDPYLIATLYMNDQYLAFRNTLAENLTQVTLLDRYYYSNRAYQGARIQNEEKRLQFYHWFDHLLEDFHMVKPQMALYLDVPKNFQQTNLQNRKKKDLHENSFEYQNTVHNEYLKMCNSNWHKLKILNCYNQDTSIIFLKIVQDIVLNHIIKNKQDPFPIVTKNKIFHNKNATWVK